MIKTSKSFIRDVVKYIEEEFRKEYEIAIDNKIQKLIIRWEMDLNMEEKKD